MTSRVGWKSRLRSLVMAFVFAVIAYTCHVESVNDDGLYGYRLTGERRSVDYWLSAGIYTGIAGSIFYLLRASGRRPEKLFELLGRTKYKGDMSP